MTKRLHDKLPGPSALARIDAVIGTTRRMLNDAFSAVEQSRAREVEVRNAQLLAYRELAAIRLDVLSGKVSDAELDSLHSSARRLLAAHQVQVQEAAQTLASAAEEVAALEAQRVSAATTHQAAVEVYEAKVETVLATLSTQEKYQRLVTASEEAEAVAARAEQKLALARTDLESKGSTYTADPLFTYLWRRKFLTAEYRAWPLTRSLDSWVARLCRYDQHYLNFNRLNQIPEWLEDNAELQNEKAELALAELVAAEQSALDAAGAESLEQEARLLLEKIEKIDAEIDSAELRHTEVAARHSRLLQAKEGPAEEALRLLHDGLQQASFENLRVLAAETVDLTDDRIVDRLVLLREEESELRSEIQRMTEHPTRLRADLTNLEDLRRLFKSSHFDSPYALFDPAGLESIISSLVSGFVSTKQAHRNLEASVRRVEPKVDPYFGGSRRAATTGMPRAMLEVIGDIAKASSRRGSSYRGSSSRPRAPRVRSRSGGFRTGGGF